MASKHDVSGEKRDKNGKWTEGDGDDVRPLSTSEPFYSYAHRAQKDFGQNEGQARTFWAEHIRQSSLHGERISDTILDDFEEEVGADALRRLIGSYSPHGETYTRKPAYADYVPRSQRVAPAAESAPVKPKRAYAPRPTATRAHKQVESRIATVIAKREALIKPILAQAAKKINAHYGLDSVTSEDAADFFRSAKRGDKDALASLGLALIKKFAAANKVADDYGAELENRIKKAVESADKPLSGKPSSSGDDKPALPSDDAAFKSLDARLGQEMARAARDYHDARGQLKSHHAKMTVREALLVKQIAALQPSVDGLLDGTGPGMTKAVAKDALKYMELNAQLHKARQGQRLAYGAVVDPGKQRLGGAIGDPSPMGVPSDLSGKGDPKPDTPTLKGVKLAILFKAVSHDVSGESRVPKGQKGGGEWASKPTYGQNVAKNLEQMGTKPGEWEAVPFDDVKEVSDGKGGVRMMPNYSLPKTYKPAPTLYRGNAAQMVCELCGTPIKNVYWLQHKGKKWVLPVGSECVTHFAEGKTGKTLTKEQVWDNNRQFLRTAIDTRKRLYAAHAEKVHAGWGKFKHIIRSREAEKTFQELDKLTYAMYADAPTPSDNTGVTRWINKNGPRVTELVAAADHLIAEKTQKAIGLTKAVAEYPCSRCQGKGAIGHFKHVLGGSCFKCGGTGKTTTKPRAASTYLPKPSGPSPELAAANKTVDTKLAKIYADDPRNAKIPHPQYANEHHREWAHYDLSRMGIKIGGYTATHLLPHLDKLGKATSQLKKSVEIGTPGYPKPMLDRLPMDSKTSVPPFKIPSFKVPSFKAPKPAGEPAPKSPVGKPASPLAAPPTNRLDSAGLADSIGGDLHEVKSRTVKPVFGKPQEQFAHMMSHSNPKSAIAALHAHLTSQGGKMGAIHEQRVPHADGGVGHLYSFDHTDTNGAKHTINMMRTATHSPSLKPKKGAAPLPHLASPPP